MLGSTGISTSLINGLLAIPGLSSSFLSPTTARLEIVAQNQLSCGAETHEVTSGYVHLDEGKMFWSLFHADEAVRTGQEGLVIQFEGGPGASGFDFPFIGAGPCQLKRDIDLTVEGEGDGSEYLEPAPYPWTRYTNLLVLDYPIGTGFSTFDEATQNPTNSSAGAAMDFDVFLQAFLRSFPKFILQPLVLSSISYGGTLIPHIASTILRHNEVDPSWSRIRKQVDLIVLGNPFSDVVAELSWQYQTTCVDTPVIYPAETCREIQSRTPECLDALAFAESTGTLEARKIATQTCVGNVDKMWKDVLQNKFYRSEEACFPGNKCFWWQDSLTAFMNKPFVRGLLGVEHLLKWNYIGPAFPRFLSHSDNMQSAFHLFEPGLNAGTKLIVYSGLEDTICGWRTSLSWMRRLPSRHLDQFRAHGDRFDALPEGSVVDGDVMNAGSDYTLMRVQRAGHVAQDSVPQLTQAIIREAVRGRNYDPLL